MTMRRFLQLMLIPAMLLLAALPGSARIYLVAAGINDYSGFPTKMNNLSKCTGDARAVADLYSANGYVDYVILTDKKASASNIVKAFKKVFSMAKADDTVIFFFSGHGYPGGFCAADGRLPYSTIRKAMAGSKARNKVIFADACRAGAMRDEATGSGKHGKKKANVMLFLASRTNENSLELSDLPNGLFTHFLTKGLNGGADTNRDNTVTAKEIYDYVSENVVSKSSGRQHPVMWGKFSNGMPVISWRR